MGWIGLGWLSYIGHSYSMSTLGAINDITIFRLTSVAGSLRSLQISFFEKEKFTFSIDYSHICITGIWML